MSSSMVLPRREIKCTRGSRQGDPLSWLLFVLVANGFNHMLVRCRRADLLEGLDMKGGTNSLVNLQFVDDTLLFGKCNIKQAATLKTVLFTLKCGMVCISISTKAQCFSLDITTSQLTWQPYILNFPVKVFPTKYLAIPIRPRTLKKRLPLWSL